MLRVILSQSVEKKKNSCEEGSRHIQFHKTFVVIVPATAVLWENEGLYLPVA